MYAIRSYYVQNRLSLGGHANKKPRHKAGGEKHTVNSIVRDISLRQRLLRFQGVLDLGHFLRLDHGVQDTSHGGTGSDGDHIQP